MLGGGPQGALAGGGGGRGAGRGADTIAGGAGARVPGGGIQAGRARSAPWKSCRSGLVPLFPFWVQRTHFEAKETEAGRVVCRGKRGVGLGLSGPSFRTEPGSGKRPFPETALVRPAALRRSWRRTKASRARALAGCGDPHTRLRPEVQLKLGLHPTNLEGGGWGWDREHSAGTSPRGAALRTISPPTSDLATATPTARLGRDRSVSTSLRAGHAVNSVLTPRALSGLLLCKNERASFPDAQFRHMQSNLRLSEGSGIWSLGAGLCHSCARRGPGDFRHIP